ncbi:glycosyltransferase family 2 protein [Flavobacterium selenitireducens]|uniref:glycosyltransferase family 2 protein n=1 Tax=Flavobacterium selenitireducens TaxID=2722704 RepID=UPI00168BBE77|nr:glycosyltransferase family 2 protein [Flavobacterium selenitireducens]MBD3583685.1 glycosyltransferase family 2 protein [Flavobacterium selenitireducens]
MDYTVVIPAFNEEKFIALTLDSLVAQTKLPTEVIVVNDNSTDSTARIAAEFALKHPWIKLVNTTSEAVHLPGSKVIRAFEKGFAVANKNFDVIVKADADLIFPNDYFERILAKFASDETIGMAGGFAYIEKNGDWILENLTDHDHIRGAFKAYRKTCFEQIGGLKPAMGWDTADELLCKFYGWNVVTLPKLRVKHLKPTGSTYDKTARYKQGAAFYTLGYGLLITAIASAKLAMRKKKPLLFLDYVNGFLKARSERKTMLVTPEQGRFVRAYRWKKIKEKLR